MAVLVLLLNGCGKSAPPVPVANCSDSIQNQNESDVDCGGPCGKCLNNKACLSDVDCQSNHCASGTCQALPSCVDGFKNQDETDVDCGGKICHACLNGKVCVGDEDCDRKYCSQGICASRPPPISCTDKFKNQDETDVDCGGSKCPKCTFGKVCSADSDCDEENTCEEKVCGVGTSCSDHLKNGEETDIDCGGTKCKKCAIGKVCTQNYDCFSNQCLEGKCASGSGGTCRDLKKNQDETDADCGGSKCQKCQTGKMCGVAEDCQSNYCADGKCWNAPPKSCLNTLKDGDETDVDCGGAQCPPCKASNKCRLGSDCISGICASGLCRP